MRFLLSAFLLMFAGSPAGAAAGDSVLSGPAWQMTWALAMVVGIILVLSALARRRFHPLRQQGAIKILEIRHLMPRKALALVEVQGHHFLLGLGADRVELVSALPPADERASTFAKELEEHSGQTT